MNGLSLFIEKGFKIEKQSKLIDGQKKINYLKVISHLHGEQTALMTIGIEKLPEYNSKEYDFSKYDYWCSKEELMLFIKTSFPDQWKNLMKQVTEAEIFYNALINKELLPIKLL